MEITPLYICISLYEGKTKEFSIKEIENFKISRGSTLHYAHRESVPPETNDNWIYFRHNNMDYKYEFMINFEEENTKFEEMIYVLRRKYSKFYYESI